jgi:hypothetical protein
MKSFQKPVENLDLGDETAAHAKTAFRRRTRPNVLEVDTNWGKDGHVKNGKEVFCQILLGVELKGNTTKAEIKYFCSPG